jgi:hypothetical protein
METAKCPNCRRFPQSISCGFWHALFLQLCPGGFKNLYQYYSNTSSGNHKRSNMLPELHFFSQTPAKRSMFLYYFPPFSLAKKTDKTKRQICKTLSAKVQS